MESDFFLPCKLKAQREKSSKSAKNQQLRKVMAAHDPKHKRDIVYWNPVFSRRNTQTRNHVTSTSISGQMNK